MDSKISAGTNSIAWTANDGMQRGYRLFNFQHEVETFRLAIERNPVEADRLHDVAIQTSIPLGTLAFAYKRGGFKEVSRYLDHHCERTMAALAELQAEGRG